MKCEYEHDFDNNILTLQLNTEVENKTISFDVVLDGDILREMAVAAFKQGGGKIVRFKGITISNVKFRDDWKMYADIEGDRP